MKKQLFILITAFTFALHGIAPHAQNVSQQGNNLDFSTWTDQQIQQWEDSVKNVLYPSLEIGVSSKQVVTEVPGAYYVSNNTYVPNSVTIDKSKATGEIPMSSSVSPSGAVTYNVPVEVYPGIHGIQPQLSVVYNNQAGNGILGVGWNIGGLSSIVRGGRSIYYDGKVQGITLTKDDAFYLNGTRLIKTSETSAQIKYESEQGNIKATANLSGTAVKYFDVYYPNGTKGTYGYTSNTSTSYLEYPLTSFSDLYGNTVTYTYTYADNHYRITKISYSNASVEFQYASVSRTDVITAYNAGLKVKEDKLLQKIVCKFGSSVLWNYEFTYAVQKEVSLLTKIGYSVANGSSLNPLIFYYGENKTTAAYTQKETQLMEWYVWTNPNQIRVSKGKFDYGTENDGLISLPNRNSYWHHYRSPNLLRHSQNRFENTYTGTEKIFLYAGLSGNFSNAMPNLTTEAGFIDIFCANLDGKYEEEAIKVNNLVSGSNDRVTFKVYCANLYSGMALKYTRTFDFPTVLTDPDGGKSIHPKFYYTGDFDGDGKSEVLAVSCHQPFGWTDKPSKCYLFDLESNKKLYEGQPFAYNVTFGGTNQQDSATIAQNTDRLYVFDYDGDGKSDICLINAQGTYIYTFDISGSSYTIRQLPSYTGLKRADLTGKLLMIGEFNGDSKPDFLLSPKVNASDWYVYYSMGNGQFEKLPVTIYSRYNTYSYHLQDVNSDGLTDVIEHTTSCYYTYRARSGGGFSSYESYTSFKYSNPIFFPTNINSRNYFHQLIALKDGKVTRFSYSRNDTKEKLLTGSVTSFGVVNKNYYRMLNESYDFDGFYSKGSGAAYPYENFHGSLYVPESREQYFNGQQVENLSYQYANAVIHKQGRGFCGFEKITTYDNIRGRTGYQKFDPVNFGVLKEEDSPTAKNTCTWSCPVASNKTAKVQLTNRSAQDKLKGITVTSSYTYDTYGSPLTETVNYGGGITENITHTYYNNTNESGYLLGFPTDRTKKTTRNGATWSERFYVQSHDSKGQATAAIRYANGNQVSSETFAYDSKGNATSHGVKSYSSTNLLTTTRTYDSYGRVTKETDPLGFNTFYEYNATDGSLYRERNHKSQYKTYSYDPFFRLSGYAYPEGTNHSFTYSWNAVGTNGLYCIMESESGKPWVKTYYDALGRETASSGLNFDYSEPRTEKQYDTYGRLQKVSLPYKGTTASYWNTYQYDSYDRLTSVTEASGRKTTYSYSGNSVTTTEDGIASTRTFDTQGNLITVSDPAGTITYNLRPDGQPSSVVAPGSVTTSFTYDGYGRRLSIIDPSAGVQSCTYDAAGNIAAETDGNNKTVSCNYDTYNRLIKKTQPEFTTTYGYNTDGLPSSETSTNGTSTAYQYDTYGRLYKEKETLPDSKWLEKTHAYANSYRQSTQYTSQSGSIVTENYYYDAGHLKEVKLNGTTSVWKLTAANAFGQSTGVTTGSFNRTYGYTAYGLPSGRTAGTFQDFTFTFDATKGNLSSRKDNKKNIQENFTYDNLNRLTGYAGKTAVYDIKGNITSKTDAGTFQYNVSGKPYAISGVTSLTNLILQRNQTVTSTSFKRPASITEAEYTAAFTYNGRGDRVKMELKKNGAKELNRYYISDCYEIDDRATGGIKEKLYLGGDFYSAPAVYVKEGTGSWNIYYLCRDYLGSITHITNSNGSVVQELSYDAWGQLRNPANQTVYTPGSVPDLFLGRGYTGHEHLSMFGLVNMNARLYDPAVGRFLSPDPYVQNPLFSQNFNRYSYVFNNPLRYTDPTGEYALIDDLIAAAIGGIVNVVVNAVQGNIHSWGQGFSYFGVGAAGTWAGLYGGPLAAGAIIGAGNSFVTQGFGSSGSWSWDNIKYDQVAMGGLMGVGMSYLGGQVSGFLSPYVSDLTSNIGGQALQQALSQGVVGSGTGFTLGAGATWLSGGSFKEGLRAGGQGAALGFTTGAVSGLVSGFRSAYKAGENPLTGKSLSTNQQSGDFFKGTEYSPKVLEQMQENSFHGFPESVKTFQQDGYITTIKGGDGVIRTQLNIPGSYKGYNGEFQFMKEPNGIINHRFFQPN